MGASERRLAPLLTLLLVGCEDGGGGKGLPGVNDSAGPPDTPDSGGTGEDSGLEEDCPDQRPTTSAPAYVEPEDLPCSGSGWNRQEALKVDGTRYLVVVNGTVCDDPLTSAVLRVYDVDSWAVAATYPYPENGLAELGDSALIGADAPALAYQFEGEAQEIEFFPLGETAAVARVLSDSEARIYNTALRGDRVELGAPYADGGGVVASFQGPLEGDVQWADAAAFIRSPVGEPSGTFGSVLDGVGDVDGDGIDDLVTGSSELWLLSGDDVVDGGEALVKLLDVWHDASEGGYGPAGDVDGDGLGDIFVVGRANRDFDWGLISFVGGQGGPAFAALTGDPAGAYPGAWIDTAGAIGDNDGDGKPEMFIASIYELDEPQHLWVSTAPECGLWSIGELGAAVPEIDEPGRFPFRAVGVEGFSAVLTWTEEGEDLGLIGSWWR